MGTTAVVDEPVRGFIPDQSILWLPGIERMRAALDGRMPPAPVQRLTGLRVTQVGHGTCTAVLPASPWFQTEAGFFLNGVSGLAADYALGGAIASALPPWHFPVTSDINITYLRPLRVDAGKLIARGRLIDSGRTQATSEAMIEDGEGRVVAHATTRCFIRSIEPFGPEYTPPAPVLEDGPDPWERPLPTDLPAFDDAREMSGIAFMKSLIGSQAVAPWARLTGARLTEAEQGWVTAEFPASPWLQSPAATIYGGLLCAYADGMSTGAALTVLAGGEETATLDLKIHFLRPALADGRPIVGAAEVIHPGRGLIVTRAVLQTEETKPLVMASGSLMRRTGRDWVPLTS